MTSKCGLIITFFYTATKGQKSDESEAKSAGGEDGGQEQTGCNHFSSPPQVRLPPSTEVLRTPQLSDFGLSEVQLNYKAPAGAEWRSKALKVKGMFGMVLCLIFSLFLPVSSWFPVIMASCTGLRSF